MKKIDYTRLELNPFSSIGEDDFLLTSGTKDSWNTMTAGWGGFGYMWNRPAVFVFVRESRYTLEFLDRNEMFSMSFFPPDEKFRHVLSTAGTKSGRTFDKMGMLGLTPVEADGTIVFEQANLMLTCRKAARIPVGKETFIDSGIMNNYPQGDWHYCFVGFIESIFVN